MIRHVVMVAACAAAAAGLAGLDPATAGVFTIAALGVLLICACAATAGLVPAPIASTCRRSYLRSGAAPPARADRSGLLSVMRR